MGRMVAVVVACMLLAGWAVAEEGKARILISKQVSSLCSTLDLIQLMQISNKFLVEGMDIVVKYNLFNVGDNAATNVQVSDSGFRQEDFDVVAGQTKYRLDRVPPGANASHTVVVRPKKFGYFNFTAAEVIYSAGEGGAPVVGLSSDPGQGVIIASRDYERQFSAHVVGSQGQGGRSNPSLAARLGSLRRDDSALPGNPLPPLVVQQVQVRGHHGCQEGVDSCCDPPDLPSAPRLADCFCHLPGCARVYCGVLSIPRQTPAYQSHSATPRGLLYPHNKLINENWLFRIF